ncbi:MAG: ribonuclease Y [Firmicutes bacterium]|nr:ribonuclease Y [Bacillota bacterium]
MQIFNMLSASTALLIILPIVAVIVGLAGGYFAALMLNGKSADKSKQSAAKIIEKALADASTVKKEALLEVKEETHKQRTELETEIRERREEIKKQESRIQSREEQLTKREEILSNKELAIESSRADIENTKKQVQRNLEDAKTKNSEAIEKLEKITGLTKAQAKKELVDCMVDDAKTEAADHVRKIMTDAEEDATKRARNVIVNAVQKLSTDVISEVTTSTIPLPTDEVKGRLIGREGRNIRAIEAATGVDLIIDDTPEAITISNFDPYRREIAKLSIEKLIQDGRIHPGRIEEIVERSKRELDNEIKKAGEDLAYDLKIHGLAPEIIKTLGRLKYRTSYGQNVYNHTREVALLSGMLAIELGANEAVAKRGGLLHDLGKATDHETDGTHTQIGVDLAKKHRETPEVIHCIEAHHGDVPFNSIEAIIVQVADALSSARPGARRENLENYVKRLRDLEEIANAKPGVEKTFAISAGREIRVIVKPEQITDEQALFMAKEIAKEIEEKLSYPGQIKVNVIRESRAVHIAK